MHNVWTILNESRVLNIGEEGVFIPPFKNQPLHTLGAGLSGPSEGRIIRSRELRPRLGISGRKSAPCLSVAPSLPLINFWGPDYPAICEGRIIQPGEEKPPQFRFSGRKSDRIPCDVPWPLLLENWGPDYPALAKPGLSGLGRKNRPSSDFVGENPTGDRVTRLGFLER